MAAIATFEGGIARLRKRLSDLGRGDEELSEILSTLADIQLANREPDPDHPTLTVDQLRHRRRRETGYCEELATDPGAAVERIEAAAVAEQALADAGLTREERAVFVLSLETTDDRIAQALQLSPRTVRSRKAAARQKLDQAHRRLARHHADQPWLFP